MNTFSDPQKIIEHIPVFAGQKVAEFGAGTGTYSFLLSKKVGASDSGMVYAIDVQKNMIDSMVAKKNQENIRNLHPVWGDIEEEKGSRLRDASVQLVLIANTLFQVEDRRAVIKEASRVLVPEGTLVIIDWAESFGNLGPREDHVLSESSARSLCQEFGFSPESSIDAGEHHYGIIARKKKFKESFS